MTKGEKKPSENESTSIVAPPSPEELEARNKERARNASGLPPEKPAGEPQGVIDTEAKGYKFTMTPEMEKFNALWEATGEKILIETESDQNRFVKEFNAWVKAGMPLPTKPQLVIEEDPIPMKLYRIKHRGREKIFWRDTKGKMHGKTVHERQVEHMGAEARMRGFALPGDKYFRTEEVVEYTIDYTKELGTKLVEDALLRCMHPTFYFIDSSDKVYSVKPEDFLADLNTIIQKHRMKVYFMNDSVMGTTDQMKV